MKTGLITKLLSGTAPAATLAGASIAAEGPRIETVPKFKTGFFPGTRTYTNYVELGVSFPSTGTYYMVMSTNLADSNAWTAFGKTNEVSVANTNTTKYLAEYAPSKFDYTFFAISEKTNSTPSPSSYVPTKSLTKTSK